MSVSIVDRMNFARSSGVILAILIKSNSILKATNPNKISAKFLKKIGLSIISIIIIAYVSFSNAHSQDDSRADEIRNISSRLRASILYNESNIRNSILN